MIAALRGKRVVQVSASAGHSLVLVEGGEAAGRVKFQLNADVAPRTCENFRSLCVGDKAGIPLNRFRILSGVCRGRRG